MSDPFDRDPDDVFESTETENPYEASDLDDPAAPYREGRFEVPTEPEETGTVELDASNVDPALQTLFWKVVFGIKLALLTTTLGVLLIVFRVNMDWGVGLLVLGFVTVGYVIYRYRDGKARMAAGEFETGEADDRQPERQAETGPETDTDQNTKTGPDTGQETKTEPDTETATKTDSADEPGERSAESANRGETA